MQVSCIKFAWWYLHHTVGELPFKLLWWLVTPWGHLLQYQKSRQLLTQQNILFNAQWIAVLTWNRVSIPRSNKQLCSNTWNVQGQPWTAKLVQGVFQLKISIPHHTIKDFLQWVVDPLVHFNPQSFYSVILEENNNKGLVILELKIQTSSSYS